MNTAKIIDIPVRAKPEIAVRDKLLWAILINPKVEEGCKCLFMKEIEEWEVVVRAKTFEKAMELAEGFCRDMGMEA